MASRTSANDAFRCVVLQIRLKPCSLPIKLLYEGTALVVKESLELNTFSRTAVITHTDWVMWRYLTPIWGRSRASLGASCCSFRIVTVAKVMHGSASVAAVAAVALDGCSHHNATRVPCCRRRDFSQYSRLWAQVLPALLGRSSKATCKLFDSRVVYLLPRIGLDAAG